MYNPPPSSFLLALARVTYLPMPHLSNFHPFHPFTLQKYTGTPAATKAQTTSVCSGELKTPLQIRNSDTQQNISGVEIHVLYGLSSAGSRYRSTISPNPVRK